MFLSFSLTSRWFLKSLMDIGLAVGFLIFLVEFSKACKLAQRNDLPLYLTNLPSLL